MKIKALLITAAALAAGVITSQAQVYSQNVVGYYNAAIPSSVGASGFGLVANQFNVGVSNGLNEIFSGGGLESDVNGVTNSVVYIWNPAGGAYGTYQYFSAADAAADAGGGAYENGAGFYDGAGNYFAPSLPPGSSVFVQNFAHTALTVTVVGTVPQGTNVITIQGSAAGKLNLIAAPIPVSTNVTTGVLSFSGTSDVNGIYNDVIYVWDPIGGTFGTYQYFSAADAAADAGGGAYENGAGFYDGAGNYQTTTVSPSVGTGFFIQHFGPNGNGSTETWTNIFTVQ